MTRREQRPDIDGGQRREVDPLGWRMVRNAVSYQ
jgi:hypothetical protein